MKRTKYITALILLLATLYQTASAQAGIYLYWQDYKEGKLNYPVDCRKKSEKIKVHTFDAKSYIEIVQHDKKIQLSKDSIYGYRDCNGKDFRIVKDYCHTYQIVENKSIVIYTTEVIEVKGKYCRIVPKFCFSNGLDANVLPLTFDNLEMVFPGNNKLRELLKTEFSSEYNIADYDKNHNMYKVNFLINESLKK